MVGASVQSKCKGFVIREYMKKPALKEMAEVFYCKVHSQQLSVKCTVSCLSRCHLSGKGDGMPAANDILL